LVSIKHHIINLNSALTDVIVSNCKDKSKILLTMTGGMDTRLILSIMLKNNIRPDLFTWDSDKNDMKIARRIAKDESLLFIPLYKKTSDSDWLESVNSIIDSYDVIFYGELMSEVFNKFVRFTESEKKLNALITNYYKWIEDNRSDLMDKKVFPCIDKKVMQIVEEIPICFRVYGYINRRLIKYNYPALLDYPHNVVNLRYRLIEMCYWCVVPILDIWCKNDSKQA